jgi:hypothetical protein
MFIVPMDGDGVTIRGLRQISGEAEFNEVFFDDFVVPAENVVGGVDNGWGTALTVLMYERLTIGLGSEGFGYRSTASPRRSARTRRPRPTPRAPAPGDLAPSCSRALHGLPHAHRALQGPDPGPGVRPGEGHDGQRGDRRGRAHRRRHRPGGPRRGLRVGVPHLVPARPEVRGRHEAILRNTIGERVLGLPPEPRLDKGIPFSELRAKEKEAVSA